MQDWITLQDVTGSTLKTFALKKQQKPSFKFVVVVVVVVVAAHQLNITCIEYFLSLFLSSFLKICGNLRKWFEFIHSSFLVNNKCVNYAFIYTCSCHKNGCVLPMCI